MKIINAHDFLSLLFDYLNNNVQYAVLRNFDGLPSRNNSRDIDIIIEKKEMERCKGNILQLICDSGWNVVTYLNNDRLTTYVCGVITDNGGVELVQLDFFLHTSVHGVILVEANDYILDRKFNGQVYHVSKEYEFLDKYLYNRVVGASFPRKYSAVREEVKDSDFVKEKLTSLFSSNDLEVIDSMSRHALIFSAVKHNLRKEFLGTLRSITGSLSLYLLNFSRSNVAPKLGFTGPDGAGKTTVIEQLHKAISSVFDKATEYHHFRPTLLPNLGAAVNSVGIKKEIDKDFNKPHRSEHKGKLNSFVRLCYYTLDYIVGSWVKIKPHSRITKFIIFDRYYTDIITDNRRSSIHLSSKFLYYWGKLLVPALDYNILLTADPDVILSRKQELDRVGIERINTELAYLSTKKGYYLVLNNGDPNEAVQQILKIVIEGQHLKNLRHLKND